MHDDDTDDPKRASARWTHNNVTWQSLYLHGVMNDIAEVLVARQGTSLSD